MSLYLGNNLIAPNQSNAANKSLSNLDSSGQSILDNKADISFSNVNDTAKILMAGMAMPSNRYINLTLGASGATYTAPANGYYNIGRVTNGQNPQYIDLVNTTTGFFVSQNNEISSIIRLNAPVRKGDVLRINYTAVGGSGDFFRFYYAQGAGSEV